MRPYHACEPHILQNLWSRLRIILRHWSEDSLPVEAARGGGGRGGGGGGGDGSGGGGDGEGGGEGGGGGGGAGCGGGGDGSGGDGGNGGVSGGDIGGCDGGCAAMNNWPIAASKAKCGSKPKSNMSRNAMNAIVPMTPQHTSRAPKRLREQL